MDQCVGLLLSPAGLARRLAQAAARAKQGLYLASSPKALAAHRDKLFEKVAYHVVDTDALPAGAVAKLVVEAIDTA